MALKYKLDSLDGLEKDVAALYEKSGDKFILKVEGIDENGDVAGLKRTIDSLKAEKKDAEKKAKEAADAAEAAATEAARKAGDVSAIEASWKAKLEKENAARDEQIKARDAQLHDLTVNATATRIAAELAVQGSADVLIPHIRSRLAYETQDGKPVVRVLGADGKPSAASVEDLQKEIAATPAFAPLIVASKASGGGAGGSKGGGAAKQLTRQAFDALDPAGRMEHVKAGGTVT
jgi:hypothetical protein